MPEEIKYSILAGPSGGSGGSMKSILENIKSIEKCINFIKTNGRITIVAVTKTFPAQDVLAALQCGIRHIGESKIQEALPKFNELNDSLVDIQKHFIGHLQTNKVKKAVENFDLIQSLDSLHLCESIDHYARIIGKIQDCFIEVKVSEENAKTGISAEEIISFYERCLAFKNIRIKGLMSIAPNCQNPQDSRPYFKRTRKLFESIQKTFNKNEFNCLSMGMSGDFEIAIEEGANFVRIGSAIFGERNYGTDK